MPGLADIIGSAVSGQEAFSADVLQARAQANFNEWYANRPGFFTPFRSSSDFGEALAAPILEPLGWGTLTALLVVGTAVAGTVFFASCIAAATTAAFGDNESYSCDTALGVGILSGFVALVAPLLAALAAILTVITSAASLIKLVTRTGATAFDSIGNAIDSLGMDEEPAISLPAPQM